MSNPADDMVMRPDLAPARPDARARAQRERQLAAARGRHGLFGRLARFRLIRKATRAMRAGIDAPMSAGLESEAGTSDAMVGRAAEGPVGMAVVLGLAIGVATLRIASGKPLEGTGTQIKQWLLGDMDAGARAAMAIRGILGSNEMVIDVLGERGGMTSQVSKLGEMILEHERRKELGRNRLEEDFPVDNWVDLVILRAKKAFEDVFSGPAAGERMRAIQWQLIQMQYGAWKAGAR